MKRLRLQNNTHAIEFESSGEGLKQAREFRASHPEFTGRKIKSVPQLEPDKVPLGQVFEL